MEKLSRIFEPIKIGSLELKNRIVMTAFAIKSTEDTVMPGVMHQKYIDFFEERAKGGVGLIILPDTAIDRNMRLQSHPCIGGDEFNPGLSALTEAVHMWGARVAPDLLDYGYRFVSKLQVYHPFGKDYRPLAPSPLSYEGRVAKEMNLEEIEWFENLFVDAAVRAKVTGFDAIHLAGHFGFIIAQFMSPRFNKRTDQYGGSLDNRMRFPLEVIEKIRAKIGNSLPIIFRLSADEFIEGGLRIDDTRIIARKLQQAGIDSLSVVAGLDLPGKHHMSIIPMGYPQGPFVELGAQIKRVVDIPVAIVGRITDPRFAENILREGKADLVGMARQLVADPETLIKARESRFTDIVPCIGCNVCLQRLVVTRTVSRCSVNAAMGREKEFKIAPAARPLKVMIIGGGPAGMEAARVASLRGHNVTLYEKGKELGGQLLISAVPPYKDDLKQYKDYLICQIKKLGIDVRLGIEVTPQMVRKVAPDAVIVATGALPLAPDIPGIHGKNVFTAWEVLAGKEIAGNKIVIAGGGMVGCETAEYLIKSGKEVVIVEAMAEIAMDVEKTNRSALLERFEQYKPAILVNATVEAVNSKGLIINKGGQRSTVEADAVIIAMGALANDDLASKLRGRVKSLHVIGDCANPGRIVDAVGMASYIARQI